MKGWQWRAIGVVLIVLGGVLGFHIQQGNQDEHERLTKQACTLAESNRAQMYRILIYLSQTPSIPEETRKALRSQASGVIRQWTCEEIQGIPPIRGPGE